MRISALIALVVGLLSPVGPALAKTKFQFNLVPITPKCDVGPSCTNGAGSCAIDSDCNVGSLSVKSKLKLDNSLRLKVKLKGVTDSAGVLVTTDGTIGSADDYILYMVASIVPQDYSSLVFGGPFLIKFDVDKGNAKIDVDLSAIGSPGSIFQHLYTFAVAPPNVPANCPGGNTTADIVTRAGDPDCTDGGFLGVTGVLQVP